MASTHDFSRDVPRRSMRNTRLSFGKYQVLAHLGQGGMGHVYLTLNVGPGGVQKLLVVKQLREDFSMQAAARAMFLDEARVATRLNHPNIVQTNEIVDDEDDLYLVMEFLDGQPLSRILDPSHNVQLSRVAKLRILVEALEGLHYAHELSDYDGTPLNVVHRDVSPQNIIVTYDGHVKLVDFGVAKASDAKTVTESGVFKGKVRYAAPEQALCAKVDRRADVFAVGTLLYEILCGRRLWQDQADASVMLALASGHIPRIRDAVPDIPPSLEAIVSKALANDMNARYASAMELRDALQDWIGEQSDDTDIGRALSVAFQKERRRLHAVIDTQVKAAREASAGALTVRQIPLLGPDSSGSLGGSSGSHGIAGTGSERSVMRGGVSLESQGRSRLPTEVPPARSRAMTMAVVGGVVFFGTLAAFFIPSRKPFSGTDAPAAATADSRVHVSLRAEPADARFTLDGRTLDKNPFEADMARDDAPHRLSVHADGYETRSIDAKLSRDLNLDVALATVAVVPAAIAAPTPPQTSAPAVVTPVVSHGYARGNNAPATTRPQAAPPQRRIDEDDPYKQ